MNCLKGRPERIGERGNNMSKSLKVQLTPPAFLEHCSGFGPCYEWPTKKITKQINNKDSREKCEKTTKRQNMKYKWLLYLRNDAQPHAW